MSSIYIPLLSALAGAVIGSAASIAAVLIRSHYEYKHQRLSLAYQAALADHDAAVNLAKGVQGRAEIAPLTGYIHFHVKYMNLLNSGELTATELTKLRAERDKMHPPQEPG